MFFVLTVQSQCPSAATSRARTIAYQAAILAGRRQTGKYLRATFEHTGYDRKQGYGSAILV